MKKPFTAISASIILGVGVFSGVPTYAQVTNPIQSKIIENQKEQAKVNQQIERLEKAIKENQQILKETKENIKETKEKIEKLQAEKEALIKQMEKREEQIKNRLRVMQAGGGPGGYIQVILGSTNFEDFISRVSAISTLTKADQDLIDQQKADAKKIEETEQTAQKELTKLNNMKEELDGMQNQIAEQKAEAETMKARLSEEGQNLLEEKERQERAAQEALLAAQSYASSSNESSSTNSTVQASSNSTVQASSNSSKSTKAESNSSSSKKPVSTPSYTVSGGSAVNVVTSAGRQFIGNSVYVWGASDPVNGRFDCSGFVHWAFKQAGIGVGRSTTALSSQGTKISTSEMRPGDLVFFDTYKKNGHVGIYLGNGNFIGSQSSTGVAVANLNGGYWGSHFKGHVRRVIN
ncbi:C40 family peptidase [Bacillus andreraoultii]|uniref:C40 family peptidase n=1 Tax=Bacillus andreraoultii TaxID=1499685 RepID=UPI00053A7193|nr:C40 family peptidase [Bacillus andreraoultii]